MTPERAKERVQRVLVLNEWLDARVRAVFSDYCEIFEIQRRYGVESFTVQDTTLEIAQDVTARGCYDTQAHSLCVDYLYLERPERLELMRQHKAQIDAQAQAHARSRKQAELAAAAAAVTRLSQELADDRR